MSHTPPDFPSPVQSSDEDMVPGPPGWADLPVTRGDFQPYRRAVLRLLETESRRAGQLSVLLWVASALGALIVAGGIPFLMYLSSTLQDVRAEVQGLRGSVTARMDAQDRQLDDVQRRQERVP